MIDPQDKPAGWSLQLEILASLSTVPQPRADLAAELGVSPQAARGALFGVEGESRVNSYWRGVYEHEPALA